MEITIKATPDDVAALVAAIQERHGKITADFALRSIGDGLAAGIQGTASTIHDSGEAGERKHA